MPADLRQDEIDHLLESIQGTTDFQSIDDTANKINAAQKTEKIAKKVQALAGRLYFAMATRADFETILEARRDLHNEAFGLWCANRGIDKNDYYAIIRRELKKRGLRFTQKNPPGYKLVKIK